MTRAVEILNTVTPEIDGTDSMLVVQQEITKISDALKAFHQNSTLHPPLMTMVTCPVGYVSANARNTAWNDYFTKDPQAKAQSTAEEWNREKMALEIIATAVNTQAKAHNCIFFMTAFQSSAFSRSWWKKYQNTPDTAANRAVFARTNQDWHEFAVILDQRAVSEPPVPSLSLQGQELISFGSGSRSISTIPRMSLLLLRPTSPAGTSRRFQWLATRRTP